MINISQSIFRKSEIMNEFSPYDTKKQNQNLENNFFRQSRLRGFRVKLSDLNTQNQNKNKMSKEVGAITLLTRLKIFSLKSARNCSVFIKEN